jgi:hypothetical protein
MIGYRQRGDDLAAFVRGSLIDSQEAEQAAVRMSAFRAAREWRRQIKTGFRTGSRLYKAKGWSKGVLVRKRTPVRYEVGDKATYSKGRSQKVGLSWVFDNAPTIRGRRGWVAVPIEGRAPVASSGRRYMWPSEAAAAGYELEIAPVMGKRYKLIMGRRGPHDHWIAMWFYIPPYRAKKGLDLDGIHRRQDAAIDQVWGEELDKRTARRARRSF